MTEPLYKRIYNDLREEILNGTRIPGSRLPTEYELTERYGVSRVTANTAMNMLRKDGLILRIPKVGSIVCEQSPYGGSKGSIRFLTGSAEDAIPGMYAAIAEEAASAGYSTVMSCYHRSREEEKSQLSYLIEQDIKGVICLPCNGECENLSLFKRIAEAKIPMVTVDQQVRLPSHTIPCTATDNRKAAYNLTSWMIEKLGHTRIAFCGDTMMQANTRYRFRGYIDALLEHGIEYDYSLVDEMDQRLLPYRSQESIFGEYLGYLMNLPEPPGAIICSNDFTALRIMKEARELGIKIPDELSVTGFDNIDLCEMLDIPLTTMAQDFTQIGKTACRQLISLINGDPVSPLILLDARLMERNSAAVYKG